MSEKQMVTVPSGAAMCTISACSSLAQAFISSMVLWMRPVMPCSRTLLAVRIIRLIARSVGFWAGRGRRAAARSDSSCSTCAACAVRSTCWRRTTTPGRSRRTAGPRTGSPARPSRRHCIAVLGSVSSWPTNLVPPRSPTSATCALRARPEDPPRRDPRQPAEEARRGRGPVAGPARLRDDRGPAAGARAARRPRRGAAGRARPGQDPAAAHDRRVCSTSGRRSSPAPSWGSTPTSRSPSGRSPPSRRTATSCASRGATAPSATPRSWRPPTPRSPT